MALPKTVDPDRFGPAAWMAATMWLLASLMVAVALPSRLVTGTLEESSTVIAWIAGLQLVLGVTLLGALGWRALSLPTVVFVLTWLSHLGIVAQWGFGMEPELLWDPRVSLSDTVLIEASMFALGFNSFYVIGVAAFSLLGSDGRNSHRIPLATGLPNEDLLKRLGAAMLAIGLFPKLFIDFSRVNLYRQGGYLATYQADAPGGFWILAPFAELGVILLAVAFWRHPVGKLWIIGLFSYELLLMFTGNRGRSFVVLLAVLIIFSALGLLKPTHMLVLAGSAWGFGYLISLIGRIRSTPFTDLPALLSAIADSFLSYTPLVTIADQGLSIIVLGVTMNFVPTPLPHSAGLNYVESAISLLPFADRLVPGIGERVVFVLQFPPNLRYGLGGSAAAESYYAFGWVGVVVGAVIGLFMCVIQRGLLRSIRDSDPIRFALGCVLVVASVWWVRGYFVEFLREVGLALFAVLGVALALRAQPSRAHKSGHDA